MATTDRRIAGRNLDTGNAALDAAQQESERAIGIVGKIALLSGVQVGPIAIGAGATVATDHKLGRQPLGWIVTDIRGAAYALDRVAWDTRTLNLRNSGADPVSVTVWVF